MIGIAPSFFLKSAIRIPHSAIVFLDFPRPFVFNQLRRSGASGRHGPPGRRAPRESPCSAPRAETPLRARAVSSSNQEMTIPSQVSNRAATILVVEDDERVRRGLQRAFESEGHRVVACGDAAEALRELHREDCCHLVVMDIELPGVSGLALCRLLRAQSATRRLPVIVVSSHDREDYKVEAFAAGATYEGADAALCAAALIDGGREKGKGESGRGQNAGMTVCVFDREGTAEEDASLVEVERLRAWLASSPSVSRRVEERGEFFLRDNEHAVEFAAPLRFEGRALGALVVAFDRRADCGQTEERLVDAAAQQAALAARISTLYEAARSASVHLAREVEHRTAEAESQRRFTEAIIDSLPVSLYAIDRDYRVVAWNRNRELGGQGIPRRDVLGRNIFEVLTRQPRGAMEE